ncbi:MAG: BrnT family toxin [Mesorhizobium sp.]
MQFEWDPEKARRNLAKHGVTFDLARKVFDDPLHLIVPDRLKMVSNDGTRSEWSKQ